MVKKDDKSTSIRDLARKIESSSNFFKELENKEKKRFITIVEGVQKDTNDEMTYTEYESIAKMIYFCDEFESLFSRQGVENADTDLLEIYRKMKTQITMFMKDFREGKKTTPSSIKVIQNYLIKVSKTLDELDEAQFIEPVDAEIIDIDAKEEEKKDGT
jgi:hypothetical protein